MRKNPSYAAAKQGISELFGAVGSSISLTAFPSSTGIPGWNADTYHNHRCFVAWVDEVRFGGDWTRIAEFARGLFAELFLRRVRPSRHVEERALELDASMRFGRLSPDAPTVPVGLDCLCGG